MEGRAEGLRSAQDALQSLHPLEPARRVRSDLCHPGGGRTEARAHHDRFHASEGAPNGCEPPKKGVLSRCIGRTKGGLNSKLHVVCNDIGKPPLVMLLSEGQMSDHKGARLMLEALPPASALIADRGYDSNWFRAALKAKGMDACIPPTRNRKQPLAYDKGLYRSRHKIENLFAKLKDWRRHPLRPMRSHLLLGYGRKPPTPHLRRPSCRGSPPWSTPWRAARRNWRARRH
ncbi:IS5/IS1182 family transposase [Bradyrhizobium sp. UFLA03-84]|nr:IS5/IS1182 family transposase [Bradyrhizobium sp. UFLA03-84]